MASLRGVVSQSKLRLAKGKPTTSEDITATWNEYISCTLSTATNISIGKGNKRLCMDKSCVVSEENYLTRAYKCAPRFIPLNLTNSDPNQVTLGKLLRQNICLVCVRILYTRLQVIDIWTLKTIVRCWIRPKIKEVGANTNIIHSTLINPKGMGNIKTFPD